MSKDGLRAVPLLSDESEEDDSQSHVNTNAFRATSGAQALRLKASLVHSSDNVLDEVDGNTAGKKEEIRSHSLFGPFPPSGPAPDSRRDSRESVESMASDKQARVHQAPALQCDQVHVDSMHLHTKPQKPNAPDGWQSGVLLAGTITMRVAVCLLVVFYVLWVGGGHAQGSPGVAGGVVSFGRFLLGLKGANIDTVIEQTEMLVLASHEVKEKGEVVPQVQEEREAGPEEQEEVLQSMCGEGVVSMGETNPLCSMLLAQKRNALMDTATKLPVRHVRKNKHPAPQVKSTRTHKHPVAKERETSVQKSEDLHREQPATLST